MTETPTARQQELVEQALELIREGGLAALTVRRLAERVGFSEAALYRHYPSKQALLHAVVGNLVEERVLSPLRRIAADRDLDPTERLIQLVTHHVLVVQEVDGLPILLLAEAAATGDDELLGLVQKAGRGLNGIFVAVLEELPAGEGRPPAAELASLLLGFSAATAVRRRVFPGIVLARPVVERLARYLTTRLVPMPPEGSP